MIQPNELRLYNRILLRGKEVELDLRQMGKLFKDSNADDLNYLGGIPITEEWLLRFGFERFGDVGKVYSKELNRKERKLFYFNGLRSVRFYEKSNNKESWFDKGDIEYVHQLQNLHFALTGKEFDLKRELA